MADKNEPQSQTQEIREKGYPSGNKPAEQVVSPAAALRPSNPTPEPPPEAPEKK